MKWIEKIKLHLRAKKYQTKYDIGGIDYLFKKIKKGQTVFDIGAHKGGYLYLILKMVGQNGSVFAFEPQSILFDYLVKIKRVFNWKNVTVEHIALSDTESETTLFIPTNKIDKDSAPGATILNNRERDDIGFSEPVLTNSLDYYCSKHNIGPNFLKIDVEGNEFNIFKGGINTLKKYKPAILVECDAGYVSRDHVIAIFDFLKSLGYNGSFVNDATRHPLTEFNFDLHQDHSNGHFFCNNFIFEMEN